MLFRSRTWKVSDLPVTYDENASDNQIVPHTYYNKVVLNKTFTNGEWQFVCFPFSLNAADIETIFGKGTEVEQFEIMEIGVKAYQSLSEEETGEDWCDDEHDGYYYRKVKDMEAGCPYLIRPTDVLSSPIILEHVRVTENRPWSYGQGYRYIQGTFQKTDEAPAFSAFFWDATDINEVKSEVNAESSNGKWYDLSGKQIVNSKSSNRQIPSGIIIVGGKKILMPRQSHSGGQRPTVND